MRMENTSVCYRREKCMVVNRHHKGVFWSSGSILYSECCGGYTDLYICGNSQNCTSKNQIIFNLKEKKQRALCKVGIMILCKKEPAPNIAFHCKCGSILRSLKLMLHHYQTHGNSINRVYRIGLSSTQFQSIYGKLILKITF